MHRIYYELATSPSPLMVQKKRDYIIKYVICNVRVKIGPENKVKNGENGG
jgi:hypothetical protein